MLSRVERLYLLRISDISVYTTKFEFEKKFYDVSKNSNYDVKLFYLSLQLPAKMHMSDYFIENFATRK